MNLIRFDKKNLLSLISIKMQIFFLSKIICTVNTEVIKKPKNNVVIDLVTVR